MWSKLIVSQTKHGISITLARHTQYFATKLEHFKSPIIQYESHGSEKLTFQIDTGQFRWNVDLIVEVKRADTNYQTGNFFNHFRVALHGI